MQNTVQNAKYDILGVVGKKVRPHGWVRPDFYWDVGGLFVFEERFDVVRGGDYEALVFCQAGAGGDEVSADNVFLHSFEGVSLALDGGFIEDLGGFLE